MNIKTIVLVISQGFSSRFILRSAIFSKLKGSGHKVVILSPSSNEEYFTKEFSGENVFHEYYDTDRYRDKNSKLSLVFTLCRLYCFKSKFSNNFTNYWRWHYFSQREKLPLLKKVYDIFLKLSIYSLGKSAFLRRLSIDVETRLTPRAHQNVFDKYNPDMLVTTSLGMLPFDRFIMQEASRNNIEIVSMILSWDNTTTKGIAGAKADKVVAWTDTMKDELINYHDVNPDNIFVGGVVQYDEYFKETNLYSKHVLFEKLDIDLNKKTIFYCLESPTAYKWNPAVIDLLGRQIDSGVIEQDTQVVIRPHPIYYRVENGVFVYEKDINELKELEKKYPFIVFDHPDVHSGKMSYDMPTSQTLKLGSLLKHSDLVICFYSSINIEASIMDTPIINVGIHHKRNLPNEVMANHAHNKRVLATGGVKSVVDESSFIKEINKYLGDRSLDSELRKKIVDQETGPNRGKAAEAIGEHLISLLEAN